MGRGQKTGSSCADVPASDDTVRRPTGPNPYAALVSCEWQAIKAKRRRRVFDASRLRHVRVPGEKRQRLRDAGVV